MSSVSVTTVHTEENPASIRYSLLTLAAEAVVSKD